MSIQTYFGTLVVIHCYRCSIAFGVPADFNSERLKRRDDFYCPAGHCQRYLGKTAEQKAVERADLAERRLNWSRAARQAEQDQREAAERSLRATKGHLTRQRKRAAHGVCPCCARTFADVARHVAGQHPDYVQAHG